MAFYEVVGRDANNPAYQSADNLTDAKQARDAMFATDKYDLVFIRQYLKDHLSRTRYRILHRLTLRK